MEIPEKKPEHDICQLFFGGQDISCFRDMVSGKRTSKIQQQPWRRLDEAFF
jgi:hypothetical protein